MRILEARGHLMTLVQPVITLKRHGRPTTKYCKEDESRAKFFLEMVEQEGACIAALLATTAQVAAPLAASVFPSASTSIIHTLVRLHTRLWHHS